MKKLIVLVIMYVFEILFVAWFLDLLTISDFDTTIVLLSVVEVGLLLYWTIFNFVKENTGIEDRTALLKINVGTPGGGKTFKATWQGMKKSKGRWLGFRVKKLISDIMEKSVFLRRFNIFYDEEEQASIEHYLNIEIHYDDNDVIVNSVAHPNYSYTLKGYKANGIIPLLFSNTSMYYSKKVSIKGKWFRVRKMFYSQRIEKLEDFISPEPDIVNNWETVDDKVKIMYMNLHRNKYPYGSVFLLDEIGYMLSQWETKKRGSGKSGYRSFVIEQFENWVRYMRHYGDFMCFMTDQQTSDVFKGARSRVGSITQCVSQLPCGIPLMFGAFKVFWKFSLYRRLYYKTQKNQDIDTSSEMVMVTRKEDLRPDRIVVSNIQYYTSRYARTQYRPLDQPDDIEYEPTVYKDIYWKK